MRILVVDDSRPMRKIVARAIRAAGITTSVIDEAEDGAQALERILSSRPDLVLTDWNMPVMSGIALLEELRLRGIDVPVGFITSESGEAFRARARAAGARFLVPKPFSPEDLGRAIKSTQAPSSWFGGEARATLGFSATGVAHLLTELFRRPVTSFPTKPMSLEPGVRVVGEFSADDESVGGAAISDMALACHAGSALAEVPAATSRQLARAGAPNAAMLEGLREVFNVCAQLFESAGMPHVHLGSVYRTPPIPAYMGLVLSHPSDRIDLYLDVAGYGSGKLTLLAIASEN